MSKVDACVEYNLPFDESEIAYELQRERTVGEEKIFEVSEAVPEIADIAQ